MRRRESNAAKPLTQKRETPINYKSMFPIKNHSESETVTSQKLHCCVMVRKEFCREIKHHYNTCTCFHNFCNVAANVFYVFHISAPC